MQSFREKISSELNELLNQDFIHAVWEGGSSATGYLDEYSDLDLMIISDDERVEDVFSLLQSFFQNNYGILKQFRIPEPAWHGMSQCFYLIDKAPRFFYLDIAVQKLVNKDKFQESDRHGIPIKWFDKKQLINPSPTPEETVLSKGKNAYKFSTELFFVVEVEVLKLIERGRLVDASIELQGSILRRLSILLNLKYRPAKVDFGLKYGYRDYPEDVYNRLRKLVTYNDIETLKANANEVIDWFYQLQEELKTDWS